MYGDHGHSMLCHECKGNDIFVDQRAGEIVCRGCGVVLGERCIDDGAEWRTFQTDDHAGRADPNRCGDVASPLHSAASGMDTIIEGGRNDKQTGRLQRLQGIVAKETASEVALKHHFGRVRELAHNMGLPSSIKEDACLLLRKAEDQGLFKTKKNERGEAMCVAVVYISCRSWGSSRPMAEMAKAANLPLRSVNKACKNLFKNMTLDIGTVRGTHLIPQLCDKLGVPPFVTIAAKHAAQEASKLDLVGGMKPSAVAAASVLLVCSCWNPAACGSKSNSRKAAGAEARARAFQGEEVGGGGTSRNEGGERKEEEELRLGPTEVAEAQEISIKAIRRPFQAMYEQRGRLFTVEFLERFVSKSVTLEALPAVLV